MVIINFNEIRCSDRSSHGCSGKYLCQIDQEPTSNATIASMIGTRRKTRWNIVQRGQQSRILVQEVRTEDLSLPSIVYSMLGNEEHWRSVVSFCEKVISQKEVAERARRGEMLDELSRV